jgi:hypothetical protein
VLLLGSRTRFFGFDPLRLRLLLLLVGDLKLIRQLLAQPRNQQQLRWDAVSVNRAELER